MPDALEVLGEDKMSISAYNAIKRLREDRAPVTELAVAAAMSRNGFPPATAENVKSDMVRLATEYGKADPVEIYSQLRSIYREESSARLFEQTAKDIRYKKLSLREAVERVGSIPISNIDESAVIDTDEMEEKAPALFEKRRALVSKKNLPTWPVMFPSLRRNLEFIEEGTITTILGKSGAGKSTIGMQFAEHLARVCGRNVLYDSTELPQFIMICRYVNKLTGIPLAQLRRGYWDEICSKAVGRYTSGGKVAFMEGGALSASTIISEARKRDADIIVDYFDMTDVSKSKFGGGFNANQTDAIGWALTEYKEYAQRSGKNVFVLTQVGKDKQNEETLRLADAMNSIKFAHRSNYGLTLNFPEMQVDLSRKIPAPPGQKELEGKLGRITDRAGSWGSLGYIYVDKDNFTGQVGLRFPVFRDGTRSRIYEVGISRIDIETGKEVENGVRQE